MGVQGPMQADDCSKRAREETQEGEVTLRIRVKSPGP